MRALAALLLVAGLAGCGSGLALRTDERLRFVTPPERAEVRGPVVLEWRMRDFRAVGFDGSAHPDRGAFAVFVDRAPMRPGRSVASLAEDDRLCRVSPGCPDRDWFAGRGVYLTRRAAIALPALPPGRGRDAGDLERHEVTVVLLDGRGRRIGEAAWTRVLFAREDGR